MANKALDLSANPRNEFGKGAARRARRAGLVPGVIYSKDTEPVHFTTDRLDLTSIVRNHGTNAVVDVDIEGEKHLTLIKHIDQNVLSLEIDHVDLLAIKRGEKVEVEVPVVYEGEPAPGALVFQEVDTLRIESDVLSIPDELTVSVEGLEIGSQITAADIVLEDGATLVDEDDLLIINIVEPQEEEPEEEEAAAEGEAVAEGEAAAEAPAEGEE
ncbi:MULTISPECIES: 50S ribosomal protein L25/general stress protein Ctc [Corynebacterium]|uniref:Large ribosomal subunit protein bL25 n=2 Tax=Corynebacterium glucuronolyticum TaxID=39791 RepID=A0A7T4EEW2_9CORY|nr:MULTISPECIES: 50S ribosomal protein L25/general stress protein Ctc [Corynebacterium]EEI62628.1 ribosomal protein L25, Ctc-form [Corynebacterium glucuronolyticum ATCC 51866]MCT1441815.1 50S ribosomal protein L25/general stress protein Ctc [Corynebacterium glucuronolyticum]MCT1562415.1 50S ribosomal protein L25/general stress protein Ctc [Corynebacterium glucuronolyticum]OFO43067.1 50S ribosomal protein L25/general stress protein Ctc [Corynebacterium sp. HMSC073D01]QQB46092.1 50S ribosomal pr